MTRAFDVNSKRKIQIASLVALMSVPAFADTYTWAPTAGGTYSWINSAHWTVGGNPTASFPNSTSDSAVLSVDIAGDQNIPLNTPITLGSLTLNDVNSTSASSEF